MCACVSVCTHINRSAFSVFLGSSIQLGGDFGISNATCETHVAFKLCPNISVESEEIHTFGTDITIGLTAFSPSAGRMLPCCGAWILKAAEGSFPHSINVHNFRPSARL